jgi:hypothetical protein
MCTRTKSSNDDTKPTTLCHTFSFVDYFKQNIDLKQLKVKELKSIANHNNLTQSGNKSAVIERIHDFFIKNKMATLIQKIIRGVFARMVISETLRGSAFKNRTICVNGTDFMTMEPIDEIPFQQWFSYTDTNNFTYGFDIHSLIMMMRKTSVKLENPYNRGALPDEVIVKMILLYKLIRIIFPEHSLESDGPYVPNRQYLRRRRARPRRVRVVATETTPENVVLAEGDTAIETQRQPVNMITRYQQATISFLSSGSYTLSREIITQLNERYRHMAEVREKPTMTRMRELFMEMDQLGNYTNPDWMIQLTIPQLNSLYRHLLNIWRYQAQIPFDVKHRICPIEDPFTPMVVERPFNPTTNEEQLDYIRKVCLVPMESMVFSGLDVEFRKLGALHVLTGLTAVSEGARDSFIWLFEAMY